VFLVFWGFVHGIARAEPAPGDVATAQALFDEGKRLMGESRFAEACPKLAESQRLDPAGGTLLALGLCHEGEGKTASAWAEFTEALSQSRIDKRADRESAASSHIRSLEPRLTRVRVVVTKESTGLEVRRNEALIGPAQWSTPLPIDPGDYVFEAHAPGKRSWRATIPIRGEGATVDVTIPPLEDAPVVVARKPSASESGPSSADHTHEPPRHGGSQDSGSSPGLLLSGIAFGGGIIATGIGVGFGMSANSQWSDARAKCPGGVCPDEASKKLGSDAGHAADIATAMFVVGGVALAAAVILYVTAPSSSDGSAQPAMASSRRSTATGRSVQLLPVVTAEGGGVVLGGRL
jgi:hypothetical protein